MSAKAKLIPALMAICIGSVPVLAQGASTGKTLTPEQKALVNAISETDAIKSLSKDYHQMIVLTGLNQHVEKDWAWVETSPQTADDKSHFDSMCGVMHKEKGKWKLVEWVGDEISHADDSQLAFNQWRKHFVKSHSGCPSTIFPTKF